MKKKFCETNPKVEKFCIIFFALMAVLMSFYFAPIYEKWSAQKEVVFQKEFFSRYHNYDEIIEDYSPDEKIEVKIREFPSGKLVFINSGERIYFVKRDMSYSNVKE